MGAIEIDGLSVVIEPKIGIVNLLSMACYAIGMVKFDREAFDFLEEYALPDVLALALAAQAHRAFSHGLLHGYLVEEQARGDARQEPGEIVRIAPRGCWRLWSNLTHAWAAL